jgi:hypothetical protein
MQLLDSSSWLRRFLFVFVTHLHTCRKPECMELLQPAGIQRYFSQLNQTE